MAVNIFTEEQKQKIINAIKEAELNTSGEIRVHIERDCPEDVLDRAAFIFEKLKMHKTKLRNGVLFYLAVKDRKFAILGDAGINAKVPEDFWDKTKELMVSHFKNGELARGLEEGIGMAGEQLKTYFAWKEDDVNELSDEISFGK
ncbi:TPM domain-containing protein [Thermophagus sp. OGC60D27]|uniref:TPM domain-containing protein n=1 Tax=Thermophagus sp. OGC60D27 TaxID=3458415 RepID=UPI0040378B37